MEIRPVNLEDARTLFEWRNDALTCAMSRNQDQVEWADHLSWLTCRLKRPGLFIAQLGGVPVGTFRVDGDEISYTVAPDQRGKGIGLRMLRIAHTMFGPLRAEIYERNTASIKVAAQAGFMVRCISAL